MDMVVLCSWGDAEVRARETFGRFSIVFYRLHFNVGSDQSGAGGFFFFLLVFNEKLQTCWKSKWYQNINFILWWLCALRSFLSKKVIS